MSLSQSKNQSIMKIFDPQNPNKRFDREYCQCRCRNRRDEQKCLKEGKEWDNTNCRCVCQSSK